MKHEAEFDAVGGMRAGNQCYRLSATDCTEDLTLYILQVVGGRRSRSLHRIRRTRDPWDAYGRYHMSGYVRNNCSVTRICDETSNDSHAGPTGIKWFNFADVYLRH